MIAVYDKLIYFNEASKYTILRMRTDDPSVPEEARSQFRDRMLRFTAVGYGLPQTDSVKLEIEGDWKEGKYGLQFHVENWHELVPPSTEGLLSYLSSGLLKGIGDSTARSIVQRFGTDTLDVLEFHPEKLLEIRGITEQKLEEIKTCYAESRAMRDIMELLTPFQVTPVTAMKIYQHFGPACTDILRKRPFRLCESSGYGFRRVDTIIRKSGGDPHDPVRIHGAMICALENARQHGHLYLEVNTLITESLQFLNEPILLPQMQVRRAEVEQKLQQMAEDNEIVSDGGRLYLPHIFMQEVESAAKAAAMLMEHTEKIDVTLPLEQVKQKLGLHLTKRQRRGVEVAMERNLSIITGGPGAGKTYTITQRILYLIHEKQIPPQKLLVITFTREAAVSMRQRFLQISPQHTTVNFGTFHSCFYQILLRSGRVSPGNILNEKQKKELIYPVLKKIKAHNALSATDLPELAKNLLTAIGYYKNTGDLQSSMDRLPEEWKNDYAQVYSGYEEASKRIRGLDFDDMLKECEELLQKDDALRIYWQNLFSYILIDEFQDINYRQYCIVRLLAQKHKNVFAVGDDDQAIYGFRGAKPACMKQFVQEFGAKQIILSTNYRSHQDIV